MNTYTMKRENLNIAKAARAKELEAVRVRMTEEVKNVVDAAIGLSGIDGYKLDEEGLDCDFTRIRITKGRDGHDVTLWYYKPWRKDERREVKLNVSAMGDFGADDTAKVEYYQLVGFLASRIEGLTKSLNAIEGWEELDTALANLRFVQSEIDALDAEEMKRQRDERVAEIEKRLVVGAEIAFTFRIDYDGEGRYVAKEILAMKVERVTAKLLWFEHHFRQYKRADVIDALVKGLDKGGWSFADEITLEQLNNQLKNR